jgi:hypothetical protein
MQFSVHWELRCIEEQEEDHEGKGFSQEDLRQVQGHSPPRRGARDLREFETQAAPGLSWRE